MLSLRRRLLPASSSATPSATLPGPAAAGDWLLRDLGKDYGPVAALREVSLSLSEGELVSVTGPSGAGKSTLGRLISGLETPSHGDIVFAGQSIAATPARQRRVAHMFESFALYPTRTVAQNVASPLEAPGSHRRWNSAERAQRVTEVLSLTEMQAYAERLPSQLSGGQKQRVALCRALVQEPSIYVLDEPIGHLDARLRHHLRGEIRRRQSGLRACTLWLTPDATEAMAVADRMVVLIGGSVQQIGTPDAVFARPANVAVARLLGDPAMNVLALRLLPGTPALATAVDPAQAPLALSPDFIARFAPLSRDGHLQLGLRPADLRLLAHGAPPAPGEELLPASVYAVEPLGRQTLVTVEVGGQRLRVKTVERGTWAPGAPLQLALPLARALSFDALTGLLQA